MLIERRKPVAPILELTPLVDVVFLLLTFYMLTSSFTREEGLPLSLPEAEATTAQQVKTISISIVDDTSVEMNGQRIAVGTLTAELKPKVTDDTVVVVRAGKDNNVQSLVRVLDQVKAANVENISLATVRGSANVSQN